MGKIADEIWARYEQWLENIREKAVKAVEEAGRDAYAEFFEFVEGEVFEIFNSVIQDFYADYTPGFYDRNESLYDILKTEATSDSFRYWFEPSEMTSFRSGYSGEDGLYNQVFRHGWHGGAGSGPGHRSPGEPYWRTPIPWYNHWKITKAKESGIAPLEDMNRRIDDYEKNQMQADFNKIAQRHLEKIRIV